MGAATPGAFHGVSISGGKESVVLMTLPLEPRVKYEAAGGISIHVGPLVFALDMAPTEKLSSNCYFPPDGCNDPSIEATVDWRTALILEKSDRKSGGLKITWPDDSHNTTAWPYQRSSPLPRIHANGATLADHAWPTVNCTSMENG